MLKARDFGEGSEVEEDSENLATASIFVYSYELNSLGTGEPWRVLSMVVTPSENNLLAEAPQFLLYLCSRGKLGNGIG